MDKYCYKSSPTGPSTAPTSSYTAMLQLYYHISFSFISLHPLISLTSPPVGAYTSSRRYLRHDPRPGDAVWQRFPRVSFARWQWPHTAASSPTTTKSLDIKATARYITPSTASTEPRFGSSQLHFIGTTSISFTRTTAQTPLLSPLLIFGSHLPPSSPSREGPLPSHSAHLSLRQLTSAAHHGTQTLPCGLLR